MALTASLQSCLTKNRASLNGLKDLMDRPDKE